MKYVGNTPYTSKDIRVNTIFKDTVTGRQLVYGEILDGSTGDISQYYSEPAKIWLKCIEKIKDDKRKRGECSFFYTEKMTLAEAHYERFLVTYFKHLMYDGKIHKHTAVPIDWLTYAYANGHVCKESGYLDHCMYTKVNDVDVCLPTPGYTNNYNPEEAQFIPCPQRFLTELILLVMRFNASH